MPRVCPHCGATGKMVGDLYKHQFVLICPRCDDRFFPSVEYM